MNNIKKEVKKKITIYSNENYLDGYIRNEFLTSNGDANIFMNLNDKNGLFDSRTSDDQLDLNSDIYDYLDSKSSILNNNIKINFYIVGLNLSSIEKEKVKHLIKEHYAIELYKIQKEYQRYKNKIISLLLIGAFFLICYALMSYNLFTEVFVFLFSFALWEAFDCLIYDFSDIKLKRESITQKLLIDIYFK